MLTLARAIIDRWLGGILMLLMAGSILNVLWQIFTRFVLQAPSSYSEELARYLLIWVGLLGAAYASGQGMHLAIDYFVHKLRPRKRRYIDMLIQSVIFLFALLAMVIGGIRLVAITLILEQTSAALQVKLGYVYMALPLSGLLIMFYAIATFIDLLQQNRQSATEMGG